jgi:putative cell wall-binding protein
VTTIAVPSLTDGTAYTFTVTAVNAIGGTESVQSTPVTPAVVVAAPPSGGGGGGGGFPTTTATNPTTNTGVIRIAGSDRYETAVAVSQTEFPNGKADAVVLATGDSYPDALVGTALATSKNAPLLLTTGQKLPTATADELGRVLPMGKTVYILGGTSAVPASVADQLTNLGYTVVRYGGATRFATAVQVADALGDPTTVLLATGTDFPDALSAGVAAAKVGGVVLLTDGTTLPTETSGYLSSHPGTAYAIGGPAAAADPSATAISGADRYATTEAVAAKFFTTPSTFGVATGLTFPDALAGGALLAHNGAPLLLSSPSALPTGVTSYITSVKAGATSAYVFGGTNAISTNVETAIGTAIGS